MPYIVTSSGAGPWQQGEILEDRVLKAHPFHAKFLRNGSVVEVSAADAAAARDTGTGSQVAELDAQLARLQAERAALLAGQAAPAAVSYALDPTHPPTATEAAAVRAAGQEVIQPGPGAPVVGAVVPAPDADAPDADAPTGSARGGKK